MLIVYFVDFGVTQIVVPTPLRPYLGELCDLGLSAPLCWRELH
jgi:UDP-N-acetylglucosamine--dolichyl-phosphate N-acetylglucosaminephosphotransferase